jgi:hypothetical protein
MKRLFFALIIAVISITSFAQSILGVKYGTPYDKALNQYQTIYHENCELLGDKIMIANPTIGDCVFDYGVISFAFVNNMSVLDGGVIVREQSLSGRAEQEKFQKDIIKLLEEKFPNDTKSSKCNDGTIFFNFGKKLTGNGKWLGSLSIDMTTKKNTCALVLNYIHFLPINNGL